MQLRQLECFRALILHGTMTRVAELMRMSQPAVSNTIAALEHSVGFALFSRRGGRLQLTPEGELFYNSVSRVLDSMDYATRAATEIRTGQRGNLTITAYPSAAMHLLPRLLSQFCADRPWVHGKIISRHSEGVKELMYTGGFDFAVAELPLDYPQKNMEVFTYDCCCILPPGHALAEKTFITPVDLDGVPFVTLFRGDPLYQQTASAFSRHGAKWNVVAEMEYFIACCETVRSGSSVGLVDPVVSAPFAKDLVMRPFKPAISYSIAILFPTTSERSKIALEFADLLRAELRPTSAG